MQHSPNCDGPDQDPSTGAYDCRYYPALDPTEEQCQSCQALADDDLDLAAELHAARHTIEVYDEAL